MAVILHGACECRPGRALMSLPRCAFIIQSFSGSCKVKNVQLVKSTGMTALHTSEYQCRAREMGLKKKKKTTFCSTKKKKLPRSKNINIGAHLMIRYTAI